MCHGMSVVVSTKVGRLLRPDANAPRDFGAYVDVLPNVQHFDYSGPGVRRSIEDSLTRLGLAYIDVAYVHDCSVMTHGERAPAVLRQVIAEAIPELERLRGEGLIRHIGVAVSHWQTCVAVLCEANLDCLLLAGRYTLLDHSALPELLPLCEARGVAYRAGWRIQFGYSCHRRRAGCATAALQLRAGARRTRCACGSDRKHLRAPWRAAARGGAAVPARASDYRSGARRRQEHRPLAGCGGENALPYPAGILAGVASRAADPRCCTDTDSSRGGAGPLRKTIAHA